MVNQPSVNDEVIKCVVVGDSGVGKTCLVCAWACNTQYDLHKLVKTHVATVWATDHYQRDREVLERSWCEVDGVQVSLRLWDTFGYHDKDRRFAYRGADVIVLCFSTVRPSSLRSIKTIWYPEIRRLCPTTPIILAGTQADLRYLYRDETYLKMEKGLLYRNIEEADIIPPVVGHETAKDIGAPFYESSVLTKYGVGDVFINSIRAALIERRKIKFWNAQLRRVQRPLIQKPVPLPDPILPKIVIAPPSAKMGLSAVLYDQSECDVTFVVKGEYIRSHRIILAVSCKFFQELFSREQLSKLPSHHEHVPPQKDPSPKSNFASNSVTSDDEFLLDNDHCELSPSPNMVVLNAVYSTQSALSPSSASFSDYPCNVFFNRSSMEAVEVRFCKDPFYNSETAAPMMFVNLDKNITCHAFQLILEYLYTGSICEVSDGGSVIQLLQAAELLQLNELKLGLDNQKAGERYLNIEIEKQFHENRKENLRRLVQEECNFLTDVRFEVDDGIVSAHKVLLMAGCEVMNAMFSNHFLEASADVVSFPGINCSTFRTLLEYIYTGETTSLAFADCLSLIETANRLCLPRLVSLAEAFIASELQRTDIKGQDAVEEAILLMEPAELHNANQLAVWCEKFISIHYREAIQSYSKIFRSLPKEKQDDIELKRWPPVWYLKELERYDRQTRDRLSNHLEQSQRQDYNRCFSGCLCFSRRARRCLEDSVNLPI